MVLHKHTWASVVFLLALLAGCKKPEVEPEQPKIREISASIEQLPSINLQWTPNDSLALHSDVQMRAVKFAMKEGAGTLTGKFTGSLEGEELVALHPYSLSHPNGYKNTFLWLQLPTEQVHARFPNLLPKIAVSYGNYLSFIHLCSVLHVSMTGEGVVGSITLRANDNSKSLSGSFRVKTDYATAPELEPQGGSNALTLQCGVKLDPYTLKDFYFAIPPGTYSGGFTLDIQTYTGDVKHVFDEDLVLRRAKVLSLPGFICQSEDETGPDNVAPNQIWYTTSDGRPLSSLKDSSFGQAILSHNSREDGWHVLSFGSPLTLVGDYAFATSFLTDIRLPDCVEELGERALSGTSLTSFRIPEKLSRLGYNVFAESKNLTRFYGKWASTDESSIILADGTLVAYAPGLLDGIIEIPKGAVALADYLFLRDSNIREVILPEGLRKVGDYAFWHQNLLERVTVPASLQEIGAHAFGYCAQLSSFEGSNGMLRNNGKALVDASGTLVAVAGSSIVHFEMPYDAKILGRGVFEGMEQLSSITFSMSLENMASDSISSCDKLEFFYGPGTTEDHHGLLLWDAANNEMILCATTTICPQDYTLPGGIDRIFWSVFRDNITTERLVIPDEVYSIGNYCFMGMRNLHTLQLPASLYEVGKQAFRNCPQLVHLYLRSASPPVYPADDASSSFAHAGLTIHVPEGTEMYYKSATGWSDYARYIQPIIYEDLPETGVYHSTDFSQDGVVSVLQKATEGAGINVVLMGDAFSDRQIANGVYDSVMKHMAEALFDKEPFASYRKLFNVYAVKVVSPSEGYGDKGQALGTWFGEGTEVGGDDSACMAYALKAISQDAMDNALLVVAMNSGRYGGTCSMYAATYGDYGAGMGLAYLPIYHLDSDFDDVLCHEAVGHGFAKLADEYASLEGEIPAAKKKDITDRVPYGWWKNVDLTGSAQDVKWSGFLQDARYHNDGLGCFEGAYDYKKGIWRPTEQSIMHYTAGGFNAPSRLAIWYKMHRLAYGTSWKYDYEDFVTYDAVNRKSSQSTASRALVPLPAPRVLSLDWKQVWTKERGRRQHREQQHRHPAHYVTVADEEAAFVQ